VEGSWTAGTSSRRSSRRDPERLCSALHVRPVWCRAFQRDLWQGKYSLSCASRFVWKSGSRQAASECCRLGVQCVFFHDLHDCCALCNLRCSFLLAQHQLFIILDDIDDSSSLGPGLRTAEMLLSSGPMGHCARTRLPELGSAYSITLMGIMLWYKRCSALVHLVNPSDHADTKCAVLQPWHRP